MYVCACVGVCVGAQSHGYLIRVMISFFQIINAFDHWRGGVKRMKSVIFWGGGTENKIDPARPGRHLAALGRDLPANSNEIRNESALWGGGSARNELDNSLFEKTDSDPKIP